jgi:hypothetical protein
VQHALLWLLRNNLHYSNVTINQHCLRIIPYIGSVPTDMTVESENDIWSHENISPDLE